MAAHVSVKRRESKKRSKGALELELHLLILSEFTNQAQYKRGETRDQWQKLRHIGESRYPVQ